MEKCSKRFALLIFNIMEWEKEKGDYNIFIKRYFIRR